MLEPPFFHLGRIPIRVTGLIILLQLIGMITMVITAGSIEPWTTFKPDLLFEKHRIWTAGTYAFFEKPSLLFIVGLFFFYRFGNEVELVLGRKSYLFLYLILLLTAPLAQSILYKLFPVATAQPGASLPILGIFLAFCAIYPEMQSFFGIRVKWFGLAFLVMASLQFIFLRDWPMFGSLAACSTFAIYLMHRSGFKQPFGLRRELLGDRPTLPSPRRKKKRTSLQRRKSARQVSPKIRPRTDYTTSDANDIDRILDKINEQGLHSLTDEERDRLKKASTKKST